MFDRDLVQATFEYVLRNKMKNGELPADQTSITCNDRYYIIDWKGVKVQQLWDKLIDEEFISTLDEADHENLFDEVLNIFIENLPIYDPTVPDSETKLSTLPYWIPLKNIPKKYYRR